MLGTLFDMAACGAIGGAFGVLSTNSFLYDIPQQSVAESIRYWQRHPETLAI